MTIRSGWIGVGVLVALLLVLPLVLTPNLMNAAIKMMIAALFALSFSLAMGQAGMLSFGHSAYYGLGAFATLHLMKAVEGNLVTWPTPLLPLAGAAAGFLCGVAFGWLATQRTGVYFAMVTLALAELLYTLAPTWNSVFGGEAGISTMRMNSWSINFASDTGVYYLTFAWVAVSTWCLWAFTRTPMGRLALAIRDNEQRVRFLGFNTHRAKTLIFATSTMFTGVAGALLAIANEATNYTIFSAQASANVVLQTFIGGAGTFFGPALGAALMTFFARMTSDLTRSWLLYQGLIFVLVMLFVPEGIGGLISAHARRLGTTAIRHLTPAVSPVPGRRGAARRRRGLHRRECARRDVGRVLGPAPHQRRRPGAVPAVRADVRSPVCRGPGPFPWCRSWPVPRCCRSPGA